MRPIVLALLLAFSWIPITAAQQPPTPAQRTWSVEGRTPQWRGRIEAAEGTIESVTVLERDASGVVLAVREGKDDAKVTFVERRDGVGQRVWRQAVPGLPPKYEAFGLVVVEGKTRADLTLAAVFNPANARPGDPYAHIIEVDIARGVLKVVGSFPYPKKSSMLQEDWFELTRAKALPSGEIVFFGGIGSGPFAWWVGLRKADGTPVWDVVSQRSLGQVVDLRQDGDGFDALVVNIMSKDFQRGTGTFRLRITATGRVAGSMKLWQRENGPRFTPDGGLAYVVPRDRQPTIIEVLDRHGQRRFTRTLTEDVYGVERCLEDGTIVLGREKGYLMLAADGDSMILVAERLYGLTILADGAVADSHCEDQECKVMTLSLFDRPR